MSVLPRDKAQQIEFCESHEAPWSANSAAIGTSAAAITDLTTKTAAARSAYDAQIAAQQAAKAATLTANQAIATMSQATRDILKQIKAKAAIDGDGVYALAEIPSPATPSPVAPPGTPYAFTVELQQGGTLVLKWKCDNPIGAVGTIYQVYRKALTESNFAFVGASGSRKFIDATVPAGLTGVVYQIIAVRSTSEEAPGLFTVNFGVGGSGQMTASVVAGGVQPKLAA